MNNLTSLRLMNKYFEYFWDKNQKLWVLYTIDENKNRIEWYENDNPIECQYFNNKKELNKFLNKQVK